MPTEKPYIVQNRYRLERELGRGGMGTVYLATDLVRHQLVAVKALPETMARDAKLMARFRREVASAVRLEHPNIVRVHDTGQGRAHYYIMRYIDGRNLHQELTRRCLFTLAESLPILRQIAAALDYAHAQGVIHRDVKPENILIDKDGTAFLTDFGVAHIIAGTRYTTGFLGTPEYAAPETFRPKSITGAADQYSLAIIAYEMLTGTTPFRHDNMHPMAVAIKHLQTSPPDPRTFQPGLSPQIAGALLTALAKQPAQRFASCDAFVQALGAKAGHPARTPAPAPKPQIAVEPQKPAPIIDKTQLRQQLDKQRRIYRTLAIVALIVFVIVLAWTLGLVFRHISLH